MCRVDITQENARYIDPLTDFGFKKIFGDELVMREFLNDIIEPPSRIEKVIFLDPNKLGGNQQEREARYDLFCRTEKGDTFIVEMQRCKQYNFSERIVYYLSRFITPQGEKGRIETVGEDGSVKYRSWNYELQPVYGIFLMDFHLENNNPVPKRTIDFFVHETQTPLTDKVKALAIELPCFKQKEHECKTGIDYWTYILNNMEHLRKDLPFVEVNSIFKRVENIAEIARMSSADRFSYQNVVETKRTEENIRDYAMEEGRREGKEEGMQQGIEKGRREGKEEGRREGKEEGKVEGERNAKFAMAKAMKADGTPSEKIVSYTGLPLEEVQKL